MEAAQEECTSSVWLWTSLFLLFVCFLFFSFCYWLFIHCILRRYLVWFHFFSELSKCVFWSKSFSKSVPHAFDKMSVVLLFGKMSQLHLFCDFWDAVSFLKCCLKFCSLLKLLPVTAVSHSLPVLDLSEGLLMGWDHVIYHCAPTAQPCWHSTLLLLVSRDSFSLTDYFFPFEVSLFLGVECLGIIFHFLGLHLSSLVNTFCLCGFLWH